MAKRSTNFTGRKPVKARHTLSLMQWVGMTDEEIKEAIARQKQEEARRASRSRPLPMDGEDFHHFGEV